VRRDTGPEITIIAIVHAPTDVCSWAHYGLESGIARGPKSADIVAKVSKRAAANFPQKNETGDIRRSIELQTRYQNRM
jgi:hypothetical protein